MSGMSNLHAHVVHCELSRVHMLCRCETDTNGILWSLLSFWYFSWAPKSLSPTLGEIMYKYVIERKTTCRRCHFCTFHELPKVRRLLWVRSCMYVIERKATCRRCRFGTFHELFIKCEIQRIKVHTYHQCWACTTFLRLRQRDIPHFFNLCATAPPRNFFSYNFAPSHQRPHGIAPFYF